MVFVGLVREMHVREGLHKERIDAMTLEHYPGMTEKALEEIEAEARRAGRSRHADRAPLRQARARRAHRAGQVGSPHREAAFEACEFLIDWLKTKAPFWKLEETPAGEKWVGAHEGDDAAAQRWEKKR